MAKYYGIILIMLFLWSGCSKDNETLHSGASVNPNYPTTYFKLDGSDFKTLKHEYLKDKDSCFQTSLNVFGFCASSSSDYNFNCTQSCIPFKQAQAKQIALNFLEKNKEFIGITDTSGIKIKSYQAFGKNVLCNTKDSTVWNVTFGNQVVNGLEVENSGIYLQLNSKGVINITGNWYPIVDIPSKEKFGYEDARKRLVGQKFDFMCWSNIHVEITSQTQWEDVATKKLIYPVINDNSIELHVVWVLQTGYFVFYVDILSGKLLGSFMTIIC